MIVKRVKTAFALLNTGENIPPRREQRNLSLCTWKSLNRKRLNVVFLFNNELLSEAVMTLGTNWEPTRAS